ncbi:hypothetical protein LCGC14_2109290 [marine sediment metagenome]|uniref:Uncharacterized protein n=1 Tax=marine sediment metagenome TaxID=412755 RepID=A0A0F9H3W8_9ZZZZ
MYEEDDAGERSYLEDWNVGKTTKDEDFWYFGKVIRGMFGLQW